MSYRVDTVPRSMRPFYLAISWVCGLILYLYYLICHLTSRISIDGPGDHDLSQHAIFCVWHHNWWSYCVVFVRYPSPHAAFSHPAAYMKPIHDSFRLMGLKPLLLGSSGEEGRRAADELARLVRNGFSTTISPDGPYGPPRVLKKGVLHVALKSGVPVVPLTITASPRISWPSWDSKKFPLPFGRIRMTVHCPIAVNAGNFDEAGRLIVAALSGPSERPRRGRFWRRPGLTVASGQW